MSLLTELQALAPFFIWRANEASGAAIDSMSLYNGTYTNTPTRQDLAITTNTLDEAPYFAGGSESGTNGHITGGSGAVSLDATTDFGLFLRIRYSALDMQRAIGGKASVVQLYTNTNGTLLFLASPAFSTFQTDIGDAVAINTNYTLFFRKKAGLLSIWINGVKKKEVAHAASLDSSSNAWSLGNMTGPLLRAHAHYAAVWVANAPTDAQILALHNRAITLPNEDPTTPVITAPTVGQTFDHSVHITWNASTDPELQPVRYEGQYSIDNGATWNTLFSLRSPIYYNWQTGGISSNVTTKVRIRAHDGVNYSPWATSAAFTLAHESTAPVLSNLEVIRVTDYSVLATVEFTDVDVGDEGEHNATNWQLWNSDGSILRYDSGWDTTNLTRRWLTGLPKNTDLLIRARARDNGGQVGVWTDFVSFKTRRVALLASLVSDPTGQTQKFNQFRNEGTDLSLVAEYGTQTHGVGWTVSTPELVPAPDGTTDEYRGFRSRWHSGAEDFVQLTGPNNSSNVIRYSSSALQPIGPISFLLVFRPEYADVIGGASYDPSGKSLLFGSESWWIYRDHDSVSARAPGVETFNSVGGLANREDNILIGTFTYESLHPQCYLVGTSYDARVNVPGKFVLWLNDQKTHMGTLDKPSGQITLEFPTIPCAIECPPLGDCIQSQSMGWGIGPTSQYNYLYLGTQDSDGARGIMDSNYYSYAGMFSHFAWWPNRVLTNREANDLLYAKSVGYDELAEEIISLEPVLYDRFWQPRPPRKPVGMIAR